MSKVSKWWKKLIAKIRKWLDDASSSEGGSSAPETVEIEAEWCFGGENGSKAKEDTSAEGYKLASFSFDGRNVKFSGSGKMWGATHSKPTARNCLFFKENGKWYGGFFEWGDGSRKTRAINNINDKYKGWQPARVAAAREFAFCLTDRGCKKRTNFMFCKNG